MARRVCELANTECKYYEREPVPELRGQAEHGCFEDKEHLIARRLGEDAISRYIIRRPENQISLCRNLHDERNYRESITGEEENPLPDREQMLGIVMVDIASGRQVPRSVRKALKKGQEEIAQNRRDVMQSFWNDLQERRA